MRGIRGGVCDRIVRGVGGLSVVMQDWWWCVRCDRIEHDAWNVVGCMGCWRGDLSDVYPSLACRIPTHVEPLPEAIGSCCFHHYWHHLLHSKVLLCIHCMFLLLWWIRSVAHTSSFSSI